MKLRIIFCTIAFFSIILSSDIQYSHNGYFDIGTIHRLSDGSIIKIPYRMLTYESTFSYNNIYLITSTALEFRLKDINNIFASDFVFDLRELYLEWMAPIGEFSIGKQIISWGSASSNNPTDNISPYNYYYLFSQGKEQKEGSLAFNSTIYLQDLKLNTVFIPEHNTNIIPFGDSEFSMGSPIIPKDEMIEKIKNPKEYGFSITIPIQSIDLTTSYFSGYDRLMSSFGANIWTTANSDPELLDAIGTIDTVLSFRHTKMYGIGFSTYVRDVSLKGDIGYFITDDESINSDSSLYRYWQTGIDRIIEHCVELNEASWDDQFQEVVCETDPKFNNSELIDNRAKYLQYTLEMEYSPTYDFTIISQLTGSQLLEIGIADSIESAYDTYLFDPEEFFIPGMGAPNTFISSTKNLLESKSLSIIVQKLLDSGIELQYTGLYDLNNKGYLNEVRINYKYNNNLTLIGAINKIQGNSKILNNQFSAMEDFSHIRMEVKYFY